MDQDVSLYVNRCHICQVGNGVSFNAKKYTPLPILKGYISMDFVMDLLRTTHCWDAIFVFFDKFAKLSHFIACGMMTNANKVTDMLYTNIAHYHGIPK